MAEVQTVVCPNPNCGTENEYGQPKCFKCGADLPVPAKPPPPRRRVSCLVKALVGVLVFPAAQMAGAMVLIMFGPLDPSPGHEGLTVVAVAVALAIAVGYLIWAIKA